MALKFNLFVCLFSIISFSYAQKNESLAQIEKLISASQAGAAPVFFDVKSKDIPDIALGKVNYEKEFILRNGLPNFISKANSSDSVRIGFIGGSITKAEHLYRTQISKHLQKMFPKSKMIGINAGISGTGSDLGAFRVSEQLLKYKPDLVFIEFAVNGAYAPGVEGIIRQTKKQLPQTDICLIYTISEGQTKPYTLRQIPKNISNLESVANHYQITSIHLGLSVATMEQDGLLIWKGKANQNPDKKIIFSNDGLHPTPQGGSLYAAAIARTFEALKNNGKLQAKVNDAVKTCFFEDNWENATMLDLKKYAQFSKDWESIDPSKTSIIDKFKPWFPYVMRASNPGAEFSFKFNGDVFGLFDIGGPEVGEITIFVDEEKGVDAKKFTNNRFNKFCNDRYRGQYFKYNLPFGEHTVRVVISSQIPNKREILGESQLDDINLNPAKYNQSVIYLGKILIKGEALPY
jgi:lysophospholipase L1-like esterase